MSNFIKWAVSPYSKPEAREYSRETKCFYIHARGGGRDFKVGTYYRYFETETEALEYIRQREENKLEQKRADRIKSAGVELLEALEMCIAWMGDRRDVSPESIDAWVKGRYAIAKARGEA